MPVVEIRRYLLTCAIFATTIGVCGSTATEIAEDVAIAPTVGRAGRDDPVLMGNGVLNDRRLGSAGGLNDDHVVMDTALGNAQQAGGLPPTTQRTPTSTPAGSTPTSAPASQNLDEREREIKLKELAVREREADKASAQAAAPWWRRADPLLLAVIAAILTMIGNMIVAYFNNTATVRQARLKADAESKLEEQKARYTLILQAIGTGDAAVAEQNIKFFIDAALLEDREHKIESALARFRPVLPSPGGRLSPQPVELSEITRIYNFPTHLDGSGQTIGLLEFGGGYRYAELVDYFTGLHLPVPQVIDVSVATSGNRPGGDARTDGQVLLDIETVGAIAPKALIRVYFSTFTENGFVDALRQAVADNVSVILIDWGRPECEWKVNEAKSVNDALRAAAAKGITVVAAAGDHGVTSGVNDGRPHVYFPASSPWVLAVGGTTVVTKRHQIVSETVWNDHLFATGGGFSELFERPDWQAAVEASAGGNGFRGRGIPDVAANASPHSGAKVLMFGAKKVVGGTTLSAAMWAGFVALINQGLGRNLGHFNPLLYKKVGPAGVLRSITKGDNSTRDVKGYHAGPGWNPAAGWGSPDGEKLLEWLRAHP